MQKAHLWFYGLNLVGLGLYVLAAIPPGGGLPTANPWMWGLAALPLLAMFFLGDLLWAVVSLARRRTRASGYIYGAVAAGWACSLTLVFAHA